MQESLQSPSWVDQGDGICGAPPCQGCPSIASPRDMTALYLPPNPPPSVFRNTAHTHDSTMARPSVAARNLSLTEELEKLEQSITLTLQGKSPGHATLRFRWTTRRGSSTAQRSTTTLANPTASSRRASFLSWSSMARTRAQSGRRPRYGRARLFCRPS